MNLETRGLGYRAKIRWDSEPRAGIHAYIPTVEPGFQRLLLNTVTVVIEKKDPYWELVRGHRNELRQAHHETTVADDTVRSLRR